MTDSLHATIAALIERHGLKDLLFAAGKVCDNESDKYTIKGDNAAAKEWNNIGTKLFFNATHFKN